MDIDKWKKLSKNLKQLRNSIEYRSSNQTIIVVDFKNKKITKVLEVLNKKAA